MTDGPRDRQTGELLWWLVGELADRLAGWMDEGGGGSSDIWRDG